MNLITNPQSYRLPTPKSLWLKCHLLYRNFAGVIFSPVSGGGGNFDNVTLSHDIFVGESLAPIALW